MRHVHTLSRYITVDFAATFAVTFLVLTFVSSLSFVFKMADLIGLGAPVMPLVRLFLYGMPTALMVSVPLAALVSSLLVFRRLSSDGEIVAMRACGVSIGQIVRGPLLFGALLVSFCLYSNHILEPHAHFARRSLRTRIRRVAIASVIEEGRFVNRIPGISIYVGERNGDDLRDIRITDAREAGVRRSIRAVRGTIRDAKDGGMVVDLYEASISPISTNTMETGYAGKWTFELDGVSRSQTYEAGIEDLTLPDLRWAIGNVEAVYPGSEFEILEKMRGKMVYVLHRRSAVAFASFAVILVGIPMGIVSRRRDSNGGVAVSLALFIGFSLLNAGIDTVSRIPSFRADLLVWVPVCLLGGIGCLLTLRVSSV